jgi:hypothetical protein
MIVDTKMILYISLFCHISSFGHSLDLKNRLVVLGPHNEVDIWLA